MPSHSEDAIRRYLEFLSNPESAVDTEAVSQAEAAVDAARESGDKLAELHARADLLRASQVNELMLEQAFIEHIGDFAASHGIPVEALREMGVADDVLRRAGLLKTVSSTRSAPRSRTTSRATRVSVTSIQDYIRSLNSGSTFTIADIGDKVGSSPATTRKAIDLLSNTEITEVTDADVIAKHSAGSRGRAPKVWQVA